MGSSILTLPPVPTFQRNPYVGLSEGALYQKGMQLTSDDINGLPAILRDSVSANPEITQQVLAGLKEQLAPSLRKSQQDTISQLEANNQLTGSTTASALGNVESDYLSALSAGGHQAAIADIDRAMANRLSLYTTGLNTLNAAGTMGLSNQSQENTFNLENYQNEVAKTLAEKKPSTGGFAGLLTGGLGGALAGFAMGGPVGAVIGGVAGGAGGYFGPEGTGGGILTAGAGVAGSKQPSYLNGLSGPNAIIPSGNVGSINGNNEQIQDILKGSPNSGSQYINKWYGGLG